MGLISRVSSRTYRRLMESPHDNPHIHYSNQHETFGSDMNDRNFDHAHQDHRRIVRKVPYDSSPGSNRPSQRRIEIRQGTPERERSPIAPQQAYQWGAIWSKSQHKIYFMNLKTRQSQWTKPLNVPDDKIENFEKMVFEMVEKDFQAPFNFEKFATVLKFLRKNDLSPEDKQILDVLHGICNTAHKFDV